jgi:hypothetical protein
MKYALDEKDLQEVLNYLAGRPFLEVHALINKLQNNAVGVNLDPPASAPELKAVENDTQAAN